MHSLAPEISVNSVVVCAETNGPLPDINPSSRPLEWLRLILSAEYVPIGFLRPWFGVSGIIRIASAAAGIMRFSSARP